MKEIYPAEVSPSQIEPQIVNEQCTKGVLDRLRARVTAFVAVGSVALAPLGGSLILETPAYADSPQVAVGMPFDGQWAYNANVAPPYTDENSSHPQAHHRYYGDWATDLYAAGGTEVRLNSVVLTERLPLHIIVQMIAVQAQVRMWRAGA